MLEPLFTMLLEQILLKDKRFTDHEIGLQNLAKEAGVPFSRASRAINTIAKKNFSEWLNELRVDEAKTLLLSSAADKYTLEAIASMAGFGSRTNFHSVFKKQTGISPSDFKNQQ